jgi:hypothetical protein
MSSRPFDVRIRPSALRSTHVEYSNGGLRYPPAGLGLPLASERVPPMMRPTRANEPQDPVTPSIVW